MKVICNIDVTTIKDTGKEAIMPAIEERRQASILVLKNKKAIIKVKNHPMTPLVSAA